MAEADLENAEKMVWRIDVPSLKKTIFVDVYRVRHSSGVLLLLIDPLRLLVEVCGFTPTANVSNKLTKLLERCVELKEVRAVHPRRYFGRGSGCVVGI